MWIWHVVKFWSGTVCVYEQCIAQGQCIEVIEVLDVEMVIINCCFSLAWIGVFQNHFWLHQGRMSNSVSCPSNWWPCQSVSKLFNRLVWCTWIHILSCLKPQAIYTLNLAYLQIRSQQGYFLPSHRFFVPLFGSCCSTLNSQKNTPPICAESCCFIICQFICPSIYR